MLHISRNSNGRYQLLPTTTRSGGWVPEQLIEQSTEPGHGVAKEGCSAKDQTNKGSEWLARVRGLADNETGWMPINLLRKIP